MSGSQKDVAAGVDAQTTFRAHLSNLVRGRVENLELSASEVSTLPFSVSEDYRLAGDFDVTEHAGVVKRQEQDEGYTENPEAFKSAAQRLLNDISRDGRVVAECEARIKGFNYLENDKSPGPLTLYRGPRRALHYTGCQNCGKAGKVQCTKCNRYGKIPCFICNGRKSYPCGTCHGNGGKYIQAPVYANGQLSRYEQRWEDCKHCEKGKVPCNPCHRTGEVLCPSCRGSLEHTCEPCAGTGWFTRIALPVIRAKYSRSYFYPNELDGRGKADLEQFLEKTGWDVAGHATFLGTEIEKSTSEWLVRVKRRFEATRTCYHGSVGGLPAPIRQFGSKHLVVHMGRIVEKLLQSDIEALRAVFEKKKKGFAWSHSELTVALRAVLATGVSRELIAAFNKAQADFTYDGIIRSVDNAVGALYAQHFHYLTSESMKLAHQRRRWKGGLFVAASALTLTFFAPRLICAYPSWFYGNGCLLSSTWPSTYAAFAVNAAQLGVASGILVALFQFLAQKRYYAKVADSSHPALATYAKKHGLGLGRRSIFTSALIGGIIAFGAAKASAPKLQSWWATSTTAVHSASGAKKANVGFQQFSRDGQRKAVRPD
jgi:hypothetical protein